MTHSKEPSSRQLLLTVDGFMEALEHPHKAAIQTLREFILSTDGRIKEQVKWNAPSFYLEDNFATLRVHPTPIVQLVLHNGSKKKANPKQFEIADPHGILKWAAKDRCVVTFSSLADTRSKLDALRPIIVSWIRQV
ncbi:MAG TPA: DUF1801 domain-containing protein [Verrucomicrobiae bacterium]|jgi:hypothetical protein|nr:DUF1801 domain-containing protein [Verrucomicrobiae bacterium]